MSGSVQRVFYPTVRSDLQPQTLWTAAMRAEAAHEAWMRAGKPLRHVETCFACGQPGIAGHCKEAGCYNVGKPLHPTLKSPDLLS